MMSRRGAARRAKGGHKLAELTKLNFVQRGNSAESPGTSNNPEFGNNTKSRPSERLAVEQLDVSGNKLYCWGKSGVSAIFREPFLWEPEQQKHDKKSGSQRKGPATR